MLLLEAILCGWFLWVSLERWWLKINDKLRTALWMINKRRRTQVIGFVEWIRDSSFNFSNGFVVVRSSPGLSGQKKNDAEHDEWNGTHSNAEESSQNADRFSEMRNIYLEYSIREIRTIASDTKWFKRGTCRNNVYNTNITCMHMSDCATKYAVVICSSNCDIFAIVAANRNAHWNEIERTERAATNALKKKREKKRK